MDKEIINIKFRGIDDFNRPVYKDIKSNTYYGSTNKLFSFHDSIEKINEYFIDNEFELDLFGKKFNCEPIGGFNHEKFKLIINV